MKKDVLACQDPALFAELAQTCEVGYLSLVTAEGYPRTIPLNFVAIDQTIYFHGARSGEKYERITADGVCGFSMVQPLAYIPSHWVSPQNGCPATQLFKSVEIKGRCTVVEDTAEKARALQALLIKHQPAATFRSFTDHTEAYAAAIGEVGIFRVDADSWTGKVKLGQNNTASRRALLRERLTERGAPVDLLTVKEMDIYNED